MSSMAAFSSSSDSERERTESSCRGRGLWKSPKVGLTLQDFKMDSYAIYMILKLGRIKHKENENR